MNEEKIEQDFNDILGKLTDNQFWVYVREWYDEQMIVDVMNEWDIEIKATAIEEMKKIMEEIKD